MTEDPADEGAAVDQAEIVEATKPPAAPPGPLSASDGKPDPKP